MTRIIAHRGFSGLYPENTMLAFRKAVKLPIDGIELDVHLTRDGEVVVAHDESLRRVAGLDRAIADMTVEELQKVTICGGESGLTDQGVPTLRQYFELVQALPIFTNIELKTGLVRYAGIEEKVMALVDEFNLRDRVLFSSFNHRSLTHLHSFAPDMGCACLFMCQMERAGDYARERGFRWVNPHYSFINDETVAELNAEGIEAQVWTVNDAEIMRDLFRRNLYVIITNYPNMALAVRKEVQGI